MQLGESQCKVPLYSVCLGDSWGRGSFRFFSELRPPIDLIFEILSKINFVSSENFFHHPTFDFDLPFPHIYLEVERFFFISALTFF